MNKPNDQQPGGADHTEPTRDCIAVAYIRARAHDKTAESKLIGKEREVCRRLADQLGARMDGEYVDRNVGASGGERDRLVDLFDRLDRKPHVCYVLAASSDRLIRNASEAIVLAWKFGQAKVDFVTASDAPTTPHRHTPPVTKRRK